MTQPYPVKPLVILPTYNERANIAKLIPAILSLQDAVHILVVDDASPDGTAGEVINCQRKGYGDRLFLSSRSAKLGLGNAYVHGFLWGLSKGYDFLVQMDADWSHPPQCLKMMLQLAAETDFVVGSRYVPGGGIRNWGAGRRLLSKFGSCFSRVVLKADFSDFTGGFNGWSAKVLQAVGLDAMRSNGYGFQIELKYLADKLGFHHVEFPFVFDERRAGSSKMSASIAVEAFWRVWQLRFSLRPAGKIKSTSV